MAGYTEGSQEINKWLKKSAHEILFFTFAINNLLSKSMQRGDGIIPGGN